MECGATYSKWTGKCDACGLWNTINEENVRRFAPEKAGRGAEKGTALTPEKLNSNSIPPPRIHSGIDEFDRVLGGGVVGSSSILLGGDPGIGKSTLLLQAVARFAEKGMKVLYVSGEEATEQIRLRAQRLGLNKTHCLLISETNLISIFATVEVEKPDLIVIDSIQTMWIGRLDAAPGTISQVRASAHELTQYVNHNATSVILVGHVTKDGQIAGPRIVEHMVDTVLYFEGERGHQFRILRSVKNRFGPANEIGVFEMTEHGLDEVKNPSALFLGERENPQPGAVVFAGIEGSRPVLSEIQALVVASPFSQPRRSVIGWDNGRLAMVLAVLEARCGISFAGHDIYLNVAGGLKITETAADFAVATALVSAKTSQTLPRKLVIFGELSLSGALRPVILADNRLKEAQKLGFTHAAMPANAKNSQRQNIHISKYADLRGFLTTQFML